MNEKTLVSKQYQKVNRFRELWHRLSQNKGAMLGLAFIIILVIVAVTADLWIDYETQVIAVNGKEAMQHPNANHWMGTDKFGRDIFLRLIYGSRYSLAVGFVAVLISLGVGVVLGAFAGYIGGQTDILIMRCLDIFDAVPTILLGVVIVSALGQSTLNLMLAVGLASAPGFAKVTRAAVMTTCNNEYVQAARALGLSEMRIIFLHVLPNCLSPIIVQVTMKIGNAVASASTLSFLGLGVPAPAPEWGSMLSQGRDYIRGYSYMTFFPGLAIMLVVLAFNLL
ncbi:MAG: ABC transporter permease, partial [Lachnospiraceae bacterium]|nr:ABC transporter permease [Lachnospiraceae bacterium]